jgi:hypothetical protein
MTRLGERWSRQTKLYASDFAASDQFGISASMYGSNAVISANLDDDKGLNSGNVITAIGCLTIFNVDAQGVSICLTW